MNPRRGSFQGKQCQLLQLQGNSFNFPLIPLIFADLYLY